MYTAGYIWENYWHGIQWNTKMNHNLKWKSWSHYLLQTAVHSVRTADVKTQQNCIWVTIAQGPHVIVVWRTLEGRTQIITHVDKWEDKRWKHDNQHLITSCSINALNAAFQRSLALQPFLNIAKGEMVTHYQSLLTFIVSECLMEEEPFDIFKTLRSD